jgi:L-fuconolactonase
MKLDAHQHFWSYDAAQYPWIPPGSALHRDWLPDDLAPLLAAA